MMTRLRLPGRATEIGVQGDDPIPAMFFRDEDRATPARIRKWIVFYAKSKFEGKLAGVNEERAEHGADPISWASLDAPPLAAQNAFVAPTAEGDTWTMFNIRKFFETADTNKVFTFTGVFFYTKQRGPGMPSILQEGDQQGGGEFDDLRVVDDDDEDDVAVSESIQDMLAGDFNEEDENGDAVSELDEDISETPGGYDDDESDGDDWGGNFASIRAKASSSASSELSTTSRNEPRAKGKGWQKRGHNKAPGRGSAAPKTRKTRRGKGRDRWLKERRDRDEACDENPPDAKESVETEPDEGDTNTDSSAPDDTTGTLLLRLKDGTYMQVIGWAIDPGITNIVYCVPIGSNGRPVLKESWNRVIHSERLTNLEYYNQGHIFMEKDIKNKWKNERRVRTTLDACSRKASLKTMNLTLLRKRLGCYYEYSRKMWSTLPSPTSGPASASTLRAGRSRSARSSLTGQARARFAPGE
ncbi:hypothetical protein THAOC_17894 [Thalassiosira oceanica]|uniref:Uncharacterized protein n=1 Tax=Thalassiosira oceanica TaxID=159749 RepID=K0SKW0_THAOC|nr:hypothetical protein THAOC_17894 [Thalassiosira oceanica]|eukprot:EJK61591.1 hypothetical protein THAOC_17894 [Thalassiosira oceanica]